MNRVAHDPTSPVEIGLLNTEVNWMANGGGSGDSGQPAALTTPQSAKQQRPALMLHLQSSSNIHHSIVSNTPISLQMESTEMTPSRIHITRSFHQDHQKRRGNEEEPSVYQGQAIPQTQPESAVTFNSAPNVDSPSVGLLRRAADLRHPNPNLIPRLPLQSDNFRTISESGSLNNSDLQHEPALGLLDPITMSSDPGTDSIRLARASGDLADVIQMSPFVRPDATPAQDPPSLRTSDPGSNLAHIVVVPTAISSSNLKKYDSEGGGEGETDKTATTPVIPTTNIHKSGTDGGATFPSSPVNKFPNSGDHDDDPSLSVTADSHLIKFHPKETWLGKKCGLLFPASCGGYNFVKVFVLMTACQVIVTCALVWLVGYLGLLSATNSLSHDIRSSVMSDVLSNVNDELSKPIRAANQIHYLTRQRFPDIDTRTSVTDDPGYLADLFHVGLQYPTVARISYVNANGVYVSIQRAKNGTEFSSTQLQAITINDPQTKQLHTYRPVPMPSRNLIPNSAPLYTRPEIRGDDSAAFIKSYLGQPIWTLNNFSVFDLTFMPAILASVEQSTLRQRDPTVTDLCAGWSAPFTAVARGDGTDDYLALSNSLPSVDPVSGNFTMAGISFVRLGDLEDSFKDQRYGTHGILHVISGGGGIVASSDASIRQELEATQSPIDLNLLANDDLIFQMAQLLRDWKLIVANATSSAPKILPINIPYTTQQFTADFHANGFNWRLNAQMLDEHLAAIPKTIVLLTRDDDFDGGFQTILRDSSIAAAAICAAAMILTFAITRCLIRPLLQVVDYMTRAVQVISMERGPGQREALAMLCEDWSRASGMRMPKFGGEDDKVTLLESSLEADTYFEDTPVYASFCWLCNNSGDTCCCYRVGRSLREVQAMHAAFGSMIYTLASYDELDAINQAKRQFIRYIFHEVRVPFNAIVLGIEQMQLELTPLGPICASTMETLTILREQSSVVSRILNDVLSMQKIEDGALALEYDSFSLEKMIRAALYAYRTPCLEKRLKVRVNLRNLDTLVNEHLPGLQLGKHTKRLSTTSSNSGILNPSPTNQINPDPTLVPHTAVTLSQHAPINNSAPNPLLPSTSAVPQVESVQLSANVFGDHYRLRQCLTNFVSNAVKFTGIGGVIRVSLELTNFEPNPLATIASDHILREMGLEPKKMSASRNTSQKRQTPPRGALKQIHTIEGPDNGGGELVEMPALNQVEGVGPNHGGPGVNQQPRTSPQPSPRNRPSEPLIPELLGTVRVRVAVKDNGSGIPLEHQAHIFEAYHQVQAGKIQAGNGTGLGLNISKSIIELHGGSIGYTSTPGAGAEFFFILPMDVMLVKSVGRSNTKESKSSDFKPQIYATHDHSPLPTIPHTDSTEVTMVHHLPKSDSSISPTNVSTLPDALPPRVSPSSAMTSVEAVRLSKGDGGAPSSSTSPIITGSASESAAALQYPLTLALSTTASSSLSTDEGTADNLPSAHPLARFNSGGVIARTSSGNVRLSSLASTTHSHAQNLVHSVMKAPATDLSVTVHPAPMTPPGVVRSLPASPATASPSVSSMGSKKAPPNSLQGCRVLVVEDSHPNRKLLISLLTHLGCKSAGAENGLECVNLFKDSLSVNTPTLSAESPVTPTVSSQSPLDGRSTSDPTSHTPTNSPIAPVSATILSASSTTTTQGPFDIILMDGSMPIMNGIEATQILRSHGLKIPIIAVTGNALDEDVKAFMLAGAEAVLTKPVNRSKLEQLLRTYFHPQQS